MEAGRVERLAERGTEALWLAPVLLVPLAVNPGGLNHELPKAALFRGLVLLTAAAHLLGWAITRPYWHPWIRRPLVRPLLLVAGATLLSTLTSISPLVSLWGSYHRQQGAYLLLSGVLWSLLLVNRLHTAAQRQRLATAVGVAGSLVAVAPFIEALRWQENPLTWRPGGTLGNPIFLSGYLIMALPFTLAQFAAWQATSTTRGISRLGWGLALALQLTALLLTQSRGPWLGAVSGLAVFGSLTLRPSRSQVLGGLFIVLALMGALAGGLRFGLVPAERLAQLPYVGRVAAATDLTGGTVRVRLVLWKAAARVVSTWPQVGLAPDPLHRLRALVGYGPDTAAAVYTRVYPPELAHIEDPEAIWDRAHNEALDILTMQGALGLMAVAVLAVGCVRQGLARWRAASSVVERANLAAPLAALLAHVVEVQFAFSLTATGMMTWLCIGLLGSWSGKGQAPDSRAEPFQAPVPRRWRVYAWAGAGLLVLLALRLEGGAVWADTLAGRARALDRAGQWEESIDLYTRAQELAPWQPMYAQFHAEALYKLARALPDQAADLKVRLLQAADRHLTQARRLDPIELEYYANAGVLHAYWSEALDGSHLETAVAYLEDGIRLAPTRTDLRVDLGHVYHNQGRYQEALRQYEAALEIDPLCVDAYYGAGMAWLALGESQRARQALQAALELDPACEPCRAALDEQ